MSAPKTGAKTWGERDKERSERGRRERGGGEHSEEQEIPALPVWWIWSQYLYCMSGYHWGCMMFAKKQMEKKRLLSVLGARACTCSCDSMLDASTHLGIIWRSAMLIVLSSVWREEVSVSTRVRECGWNLQYPLSKQLWHTAQTAPHVTRAWLCVSAGWVGMIGFGDGRVSAGAILFTPSQTPGPQHAHDCDCPAVRAARRVGVRWDKCQEHPILHWHVHCRASCASGLEEAQSLLAYCDSMCWTRVWQPRLHAYFTRWRTHAHIHTTFLLCF